VNFADDLLCICPDAWIYRDGSPRGMWDVLLRCFQAANFQPLFIVVAGVWHLWRCAWTRQEISEPVSARGKLLGVPPREERVTSCSPAKRLDGPYAWDHALAGRYTEHSRRQVVGGANTPCRNGYNHSTLGPGRLQPCSLWRIGYDLEVIGEATNPPFERTGMSHQFGPPIRSSECHEAPGARQQAFNCPLKRKSQWPALPSRSRSFRRGWDRTARHRGCLVLPSILMRIRSIISSVCTTAVLLSVLSFPARAFDGTVVQLLDFIVDWRGFIGRDVILQGGRIAMASNDTAFLHSDAGTIALIAPWTNREDLRYVLTYCRGMGRNPMCQTTVSGTVTDYLGKMPALKGVSILRP